MTDEQIINLIKKYGNTSRKRDFILIPFTEFPAIDSSGREREYDWYAKRIESVLQSNDVVFANYVNKAICIKKGGF